MQRIRSCRKKLLHGFRNSLHKQRNEYHERTNVTQNPLSNILDVEAQFNTNKRPAPAYPLHQTPQTLDIKIINPSMNKTNKFKRKKWEVMS